MQDAGEQGARLDAHVDDGARAARLGRLEPEHQVRLRPGVSLDDLHVISRVKDAIVCQSMCNSARAGNEDNILQ